MYYAISSLYSSPKSSVVLNNLATDWFECPIGVKQGDTISPTLFAIYINDLAEELKRSGVGVRLDGGFQVPCLFYADDIVLLAETEADLQDLLNIVNLWCSKWRLEVNLLKTNIMHVRKNQVQRTMFEFKFEGKKVEFCDQYRYLGVTLNANLNFEKTTEELCDSAGRALNSIVTKMIKNGGFPLRVYKILYESCVCTITDYSSEVFGFKEYGSIEKIHSKAIRVFLGVSKTSPIPGLRSELNWLEPRSRTQVKMVRMLHRLCNLPDSRITKRIFLWDLQISERSNFSTWSKECKEILNRNDLSDVFTQNIFDVKVVTNALKAKLALKDQLKLKNQAKGLPKLRTFCQISDFSFEKSYLSKPLSFVQRKALAKFRIGVLQIRIETGRYERPKKSHLERICKQCDHNISEDETHFLLYCPRHVILRGTFFSKNYFTWVLNSN